MGTTQSKQQTKKISHQRFVSSKINPDKQIIQSEIPADFNKYDFNYWKQMLKNVKSNADSKFLFLPLSFDQQMPSTACNALPKLKLTFPYFPYLLQQQIKNRVQGPSKNYFDQQQLWMLLYSLLKSQRAFSNLSLKVGDIHPHNIFINQEGYPRLACQFSWPNQETNFDKMRTQKTHRFLSPEQMKLCQMGQYPDLCQSVTSQAFSIGLTILSAGLLQKLEQLYDIKSYTFNQIIFAKVLDRWETLKYKSQRSGQFTSYSKQLTQIVKSLCRINPKQRQLPSKIYEQLQPYQQKILSVEQFNFNKNQPSNKDIPERDNKNDNLYYKDLFSKYANSNYKPIQTQQQRPWNDLQLTQSVHQKIKSKKQNKNNPDSQISVYQYRNYQSNIRHAPSGSTFSGTNSVSNNANTPTFNFNTGLSNQNILPLSINTDLIKKNNNYQNLKFSSNYYQPVKIVKNQQTHNPVHYQRNIQSYQIRQVIRNQDNSDFNVDKKSQFLQKLQKQIQISQRSFPGTNSSQ